MSDDRKIFVNLPIASLKRSVAFFTALGFTFNPQFTNESTTCMIVNEGAYCMLLEAPVFQGFINKQLCETATHTEVLLAFSVNSRAEVDEVVKKALDAGGAPSMPAIDHGFMYGWSFRDPDGHNWEVFYMDPAHVQG